MGIIPKEEQEKDDDNGMEIMYHGYHNHRQNTISAKESRVERLKERAKANHLMLL